MDRPRCFALRFGHMEVVQLLLKNQADPTVENENGETAVDWALKRNTDIEAILREAGGRSGKKVVLDVEQVLIPGWNIIPAYGDPDLPAGSGTSLTIR